MNQLLASILLVVLSIITLVESAYAERRVLRITPVAQQTELWCWAAVAQMALRHYGYRSINPNGNFQCGVVAMLGGRCNRDCQSCVRGISSIARFEEALEQYQDIARQIGRGGKRVRIKDRSTLHWSKVFSEIREGDPVIAGISPSGLADLYPRGIGEHVVLIIGYDAPRNEPENLYWIVNDPYPYRALGYDPYTKVGGKMLRPGRYRIHYRTFQERLGYRDSIIFD